MENWRRAARHFGEELVEDVVLLGHARASRCQPHHYFLVPETIYRREAGLVPCLLELRGAHARLLPAPAALKSRLRMFSKVLPPASLYGLRLRRSVSRWVLQPIPISRMALGIVLSTMGTCCSARRRTAAYRCLHPLGSEISLLWCPVAPAGSELWGTTARSSWLCHRCRPWVGPSTWILESPHRPPSTPCAVWRGRPRGYFARCHGVGDPLGALDYCPRIGRLLFVGVPDLSSAHPR